MLTASSRIRGSVGAAGLRIELGALVLGHALLLGWLAWLVLVAWMVDGMLTFLAAGIRRHSLPQ